MNSFLKWPGGKRWLISKYHDLLPKQYNRYIEPFVGGGSVFFSLSPTNALISDINPELINMYVVMRDNPDDLKQILLQHHRNHSEGYYYEIRGIIPADNVEQAARFLYLNRTCFNGMYRVNRDGMFNVPIGTKSNCIYDIDKFTDYSKSLSNIQIVVSDFSPIIREAYPRDLVFVDPPYTIAHNQNSFIKYNERLFTWADQERLINDLCHARDNNAIVIATNANYHLISEMYNDHGFYTTVIHRYSSISGRIDRRGIQEELLITSMPIVLEE